MTRAKRVSRIVYNRVSEKNNNRRGSYRNYQANKSRKRQHIAALTMYGSVFCVLAGAFVIVFMLLQNVSIVDENQRLVGRNYTLGEKAQNLRNELNALMDRNDICARAGQELRMIESASYQTIYVKPTVISRVASASGAQ